MDAATEAGTELVLEVFRVNGLLLTAGERIAAREGVTSARWQVLGAVALAERPVTVPQIARRMGLARQSVQASVNRLVDEDMLAGEPNAEHRRSPVFGLTERGAAAYARLTEHQQEWIADVTSGLSAEDLATVSEVLRALSTRLGAHEGEGTRS